MRAITRAFVAISVALAVVLASGSAAARSAPLAGAGVEEHVGVHLPTGLVLRDRHGEAVRLDDWLADAAGRPIVLTLAYFHCRMLCGRVLGGEARVIRKAGLEPGRDLRLLTVSIDPRDDAKSAAKRRDVVLASLEKTPSSTVWPFWTGEEQTVARLADRVGFRYQFDPKSGQYAHPAVIIVLTPDGRVSSYLYGIDFAAADLRTAVALARDGGTGASTPAILLRCFQYIPALRRYAGAIALFLRIGAALSLVAFGFAVWMLVRRRRRSEASS